MSSNSKPTSWSVPTQIKLRLTGRSAPLVMGGLIALVVSGMIAISVFASASSMAGGAPSTRLANKQQSIQHMLDAQATAAARASHLPKHTQPVQPPSSCPMPTPSGVIAQGGGGQFKNEQILSSVRVNPVEGGPFTYFIFSGALGSEPTQGVIIVERLSADSCLPSSQSTRITYYDTPSPHGAVTITQVSGDVIVFMTQSGAVGRFDFFTGQYE